MIKKSDILERVTEKEIMEYYYNTSIVDRRPTYRNLMRNDSNGTCYFNWYNCHYYLVDRARGFHANFDCFSLVKHIKGCNFKDALNHINVDMNLGLNGKKNFKSIPGRKIKSSKKVNKYYKRKINYKIVCKKFEESDLFYWMRFGITHQTLYFYNVRAVKSYKSDSNESFKFQLKYTHKKQDPCYCYIFKGKKATRVKLYQPLSKTSKWRSNVNSKDIFGLEQLPEKGDLLFIVSGGKDMMCMKEMDYWSIAGQSETSIINEEVINNLKKRFKKIVVLLDNDNAGINSSKIYKEKYNLDYLVLPNLGSQKDVAEFVEAYGLDQTKNLIKELLNGKSE
jgi:hypothetical protein